MKEIYFKVKHKTIKIVINISMCTSIFTIFNKVNRKDCYLYIFQMIQQ